MQANPISMSVPLKAKYRGICPCTVILRLTRHFIPNGHYFLKGHFKKVGKKKSKYQELSTVGHVSMLKRGKALEKDEITLPLRTDGPSVRDFEVCEL